MPSLRNVAAPYWAEFIGTMLLTVIGLGITAQNLTSQTTRRTEALSSSLAWGLAVTIGIWVSSHVSGGHINPAVTISRSLFNSHPWSRTLGYISSQTLGALAGAFVVWLNFAASLAALKHKDGLHPAALAFVTSNDTWYGLINEVTASFIFVLAIYAITDNSSEAKGLAPLAIGLALTGASLAVSSPLAVAVNPARDFGPRVFAAFVYGLGVFSDHSFYFWVPLVGPVVGGVLGAFVYEWLVKRDAEYQHTLEEGA
ncbi:glycerol channel [Coemansia sp. RSA 2703]|nr:glycerol channel [Coemansia sp. RSA 2703]KAJ2373404.1 glycerol channel [Coemansia sp. RSA 2607]